MEILIYCLLIMSLIIYIIYKIRQNNRLNNSFNSKTLVFDVSISAMREDELMNLLNNKKDLEVNQLKEIKNALLKINPKNKERIKL